MRDIPYDIRPDTAYHPAFADGAIARIRTQSTYGERMSEALSYVVAEKVWAVIIEEEGIPLYIAQNLAFTQTSLPYRRVLCVPFHGTSTPVGSSPTTEECDP